jgi:hypothetical protein
MIAAAGAAAGLTFESEPLCIPLIRHEAEV